MPQPRERDLTDDRDRRGVQEVGDLGAGDGGPDDDVALLVDQETARAAVLAVVDPAGLASVQVSLPVWRNAAGRAGYRLIGRMMLRRR